MARPSGSLTMTRISGGRCQPVSHGETSRMIQKAGRRDQEGEAEGGGGVRYAQQQGETRRSHGGKQPGAAPAGDEGDDQC